MKLNKSAIDLLRAKQCLSMVDISKLAKVGTNTIYAGFTRDIDPLPVGRIAKALGVDPEEIILKEQ